MDPLIARSFEIHELSRRSFDHQFTFRKGDSWVYTGTVCVQINRGLLRILFSGQFHFQILLRTFFSSPLTRESFEWWCILDQIFIFFPFSYVKVEFSRVLFPNVLISSVHSNFVLRVEDYLLKNWIIKSFVLKTSHSWSYVYVFCLQIGQIIKIQNFQLSRVFNFQELT